MIIMDIDSALNKLSYHPITHPTFSPGGEIGCLLIHGFTSTPKELLWLSEYLVEQGYTVLTIRLTHHGTEVSDMLRSHWEDWFFSVLDGYFILKGFCTRIIPIGLSLGGVLALILSATYPTDGVVTMSTPFHLKYNHRGIELLKFVFPLVPYIKKTKRFWNDPAKEEWHVDYPVIPIRAVTELNKCLKVLRHVIYRVQKPVLLIHSRSDKNIAPANMELLFNALSSTDKKMFWIEKSGHIITEDSEKQIVFAEIGKWIKFHFP